VDGVRAIGVDETSFLSATGTHPTLVAAVISDATTEALHSGGVVSVRLKDRPPFYGS
jgi:hypothetical protein